MIALPSHKEAHKMADTVRPEWVLKVKGIVKTLFAKYKDDFVAKKRKAAAKYSYGGAWKRGT